MVLVQGSAPTLVRAVITATSRQADDVISTRSALISTNKRVLATVQGRLLRRASTLVPGISNKVRVSFLERIECSFLPLLRVHLRVRVLRREVLLRLRVLLLLLHLVRAGVGPPVPRHPHSALATMRLRVSKAIMRVHSQMRVLMLLLAQLLRAPPRIRHRVQGAAAF